jgi:hypothetical protein
MSTGEYMFWCFKETTPAGAMIMIMIMKIDSGFCSMAYGRTP